MFNCRSDFFTLNTFPNHTDKPKFFWVRQTRQGGKAPARLPFVGAVAPS